MYKYFTFVYCLDFCRSIFVDCLFQFFYKFHSLFKVNGKVFLAKVVLTTCPTRSLVAWYRLMFRPTRPQSLHIDVKHNGIHKYLDLIGLKLIVQRNCLYIKMCKLCNMI